EKKPDPTRSTGRRDACRSPPPPHRSRGTCRMKATSFTPFLGSTQPTSPAALLPAFDFHPLTRVVFGPGSPSNLGDLVRELGGRRVLLVTDPGLEEAGHPQRALEILRSAGLEAWVFDHVEENPTTRHVEDGLETAREHRIDFLVAVGGGSSMD